MKARARAIAVLARVRATDAYLSAVLDAQLSESALDARDAGLVTELCYGTTRREMLLDRALALHSDRRLETLEDRVLCALRVGAYQMFFTRVPRRAAVAETVEALKELGLARAAGFANAVLRRTAELEAPPLPPPDDWAEHLAVRESHPQWLVERWLRQLGAERAEAMLQADNAAAPLVLRANGAKLSRDALLAQLREAGLEAQPTVCSPQGVVLTGAGSPEEIFGYREGLWQVQDEAAQLVGVYADLPAGARVLDACAAPGGKACHLAERCEVVAVDLHAHKLRKLAFQAERLGLSARIRAFAHDATQPFPAEVGPVDAVLLDAPCTGLGTLRRHPELRYRRRPEDVARLAELQAHLLERCASQVPPGGLLVYAVCSPEPEEGTEQIRRFLEAHPDFALDPPAAEGATRTSALPLDAGCLVTLPGREGWDGFFAARLRRQVR
jgi:16S rRNA (cytosine967-C5)-methyltransferase